MKSQGDSLPKWYVPVLQLLNYILFKTKNIAQIIIENNLLSVMVKQRFFYWQHDIGTTNFQCLDKGRVKNHTSI